MHLHTSECSKCGKSSVYEMVDAAFENGYAGNKARTLSQPVHPVAEKVGLAHPEHGHGEYRVPPERDEDARGGVLQECGAHGHDGHEQQEHAQRAGKELLLGHAAEHKPDDGAENEQEPAGELKLEERHAEWVPVCLEEQERHPEDINAQQHGAGAALGMHACQLPAEMLRADQHIQAEQLKELIQISTLSFFKVFPREQLTP